MEDSRLLDDPKVVLLAGMLAAALEDPSGVPPDEVARLELYRERLGLNEACHSAALNRIASSTAEWDAAVGRGAEVQAYLHVLAAVLQQIEVVDHAAAMPFDDARLQLYRQRHGVGDDVHAAALQVLGLPSLQAGTTGEDARAPYVAAYRKMLTQAMNDQRAADTKSSPAAVVTDESLAEFRATHGITAAMHAAAVRALGTDQETLDSMRADRLERRLQTLEHATAEQRVELEQLDKALASSEELSRGAEFFSPEVAVEVGHMERALLTTEEDSAKLRLELGTRRAKMAAVQRLLDQREAEFYETVRANTPACFPHVHVRWPFACRCATWTTHGAIATRYAGGGMPRGGWQAAGAPSGAGTARAHACRD